MGSAMQRQSEGGNYVGESGVGWTAWSMKMRRDATTFLNKQEERFEERDRRRIDEA